MGPGSLAFDFVSGRSGFINPSMQLLHEAQEVFESRPIACLINVGNGSPFECDWGRLLYSRRLLPAALVGPYADTFQQPRQIAVTLKERYFRFDVPRYLYDLSRWDQDEAVRTVVDTNAYLDREDVQQALDRAVEVMIRCHGHRRCAENDAKWFLA